MNKPARDKPVIRLGVLGGSNSMTRTGYVPRAVERLEAAGYGIHLTNKAVGATNSFSGLANLVKTGFGKTLDILLVEFCLNDTESFARSPELLSVWARAFEGMLRRARASNSSLIIIPVLLENRENARHPKLTPVHAGMLRIAIRYGLSCVDIVEATSREGIDSAEMFRDGSHYSEPFGVEFIAERVTEAILNAMPEPGAAPGRQPIRMPLPVDRRSYGAAKYTEDLERYADLPLPRVRFSNSWRDLETWQIEPGNPLRFLLSGRLLMMEFVSTAASPNLKIGFGDTTVIQPTTRVTFATRRHPFLLSTLVPVVHGGYDVAGKQMIVTIDTSSEAPPPSGEASGNEAVGRFMAPLQDTDPTFYPTGLLYVGDLRQI